MKLVFSLGNPEKQYSGTRHNVGFLVADTIARDAGVSFKLSTRFHALIAECTVDGEKVIIAKPQTYYNLVGQSFRAISDFYKISPSDSLIIHDELALPFGTLRTRVGGSDAGNNGIKSINQHGGAEAARLRIGIATDQRAVMGDTDFVLARFTKEESSQFEKTIMPRVVEIIEQFVGGNHQITSHKISDKEAS